MATKKTKEAEKKPVQELLRMLHDTFEEMLGECTGDDGVIRAKVDNIGVLGAQVIVEVMLEGGLQETAPRGVLRFHTILAENVPEESVADLLIALNALNHAMCAGACQGFGVFCYYEHLNQVYLGYRMPVNLTQIEANYDNIRYYLTVLYEQLDVFIDFIMFTLTSPGSMDISEYMSYLNEVADIDDLEERFKVFEEQFAEMAKRLGYDSDEIEAVKLSDGEPEGEV